MSEGSYWSGRASSYRSEGLYLEANRALVNAEEADRRAETRVYERRAQEGREFERNMQWAMGHRDSNPISELMGNCAELCITGRGETLHEVVIKANSMFARAVLDPLAGQNQRMPDSSHLCTFLQEMDREEDITQEAERREIQDARIRARARINIAVATCAGSFGAFITVPFPCPVVPLVAGVVMGGVGGLISELTDGLNCAVPLAEKTLDMHNRRTKRLEEKVQKIVRERGLPDKEERELTQLKQAEESFSATIRGYREWEAHRFDKQ